MSVAGGGGSPPGPEPPADGPGPGASSPYVGLRPYTDAESSIFFGRERERRVVASNLLASRLTLLYGPSGVGKSSMLNAAVVPHLSAVAADQTGDGDLPPYEVVVFNSWRDDPVAALVQCIVGGDPATGRDIPLATALRERAEGGGADLLVILDQFEEYFLYHGGQGADDRFAREFPEAVNDPALRVNFLLSFREDALANLDLFKGVIPRLFGNYLRVGYLDAEGARRAIAGPVDRYNLTSPNDPVDVEPTLVEKVLEQVEAGKVVVGQAGAGAVLAGPGDRPQSAIETSHLQIVMARLWSEEMATGSRVLRVATLDRLGGAAEIVSGHLDRELRSLSEHLQDVAAAAFEHLVTPSGSKIAHSAPDLAILSGVSESDLGEVVTRLSAGTSRVLRPVEPAPGRSAERYEIFHDVLAAAILDWRTRYVQRRERAEAEEELRRQRRAAEEKARAARRRARNLSVFSLVSALLVVALVVALTAQRQRNNARSRQQAAEAVALLSVDPTMSIRGALEALDTAHTPEAESALRQAVAGSHLRRVLTGHRDWVTTVAFDAQGAGLVTTSLDRTARIWDVATGDERAVLEHGHWVATGTFDASGGAVLTSSADGTARLWDAVQGKEVRRLGQAASDRPEQPPTAVPAVTLPSPRPDVAAPPAGSVTGAPDAPLVTATFDPAGTTAITAGDDGVVRLWDVASGVEVRQLRGHGGLVTSAVFDGAGSHVVTAGGDGTVRVWDAATGEELALLDEHDGRVAGARFSPDGAMVASAGWDGNAYLWRWQSGDALVLSGHRDKLASIEFDRSGSRVVTAGDKTARVWDTASGQMVANLRGHSGFVDAAVFNGDGSRVATASQDGSARVWDLATESPLVELHGHAEIVWDVAFSPTDDRLLATAGSDGTARLWELPEQLTLSHPSWVLDAEFSGDGRLVVTSGQDGTARVWDAVTGRQETALPGHAVRAVAAISADGRHVATVDDAQVRVWDARGGDQPIAATAELRRGHLRFTPSGDLLVTDVDGTVYRWDWVNNAPVRRLTGYRGVITVTDLQVSADGRWFVTAGSDRVARLWDVETGRETFTFRGHDGVVYSARFSKDGRFVVTSSADGTARIWNADTGEQVRTLVADRPLRAAAFDRTGDRIVAGAVDGSIRIWDVPSGRTLSILSRHSHAVNTVVFSPDGQQILSASDDGTAAIYTCPTCDDLSELRHRAEQRLVQVGELVERTISGWALAPGVCYDRVDDHAVVVDCDAPHDGEAFAVLEHPAGSGVPFDPGAVDAFGLEQCGGAPLLDYVGVRPARSAYQVAVWAPTRETWVSGDRRIVCVVYGPGQLTGSARGSGR